MSQSEQHFGIRSAHRGFGSGAFGGMLLRGAALRSRCPRSLTCAHLRSLLSSFILLSALVAPALASFALADEQAVPVATLRTVPLFIEVERLAGEDPARSDARARGVVVLANRILISLGVALDVQSVSVVDGILPGASTTDVLRDRLSAWKNQLAPGAHVLSLITPRDRYHGLSVPSYLCNGNYSVIVVADQTATSLLGVSLDPATVAGLQWTALSQNGATLAHEFGHRLGLEHNHGECDNGLPGLPLMYDNVTSVHCGFTQPEMEQVAAVLSQSCLADAALPVSAPGVTGPRSLALSAAPGAADYQFSSDTIGHAEGLPAGVGYDIFSGHLSVPTKSQVAYKYAAFKIVSESIFGSSALSVELAVPNSPPRFPKGDPIVIRSKKGKVNAKVTVVDSDKKDKVVVSCQSLPGLKVKVKSGKGKAVVTIQGRVSATTQLSCTAWNPGYEAAVAQRLSREAAAGGGASFSNFLITR